MFHPWWSLLLKTVHVLEIIIYNRDQPLQWYKQMWPIMWVILTENRKLPNILKYAFVVGDYALH